MMIDHICFIGNDWFIDMGELKIFCQPTVALISHSNQGEEEVIEERKFEKEEYEIIPVIMMTVFSCNIFGLLLLCCISSIQEAQSDLQTVKDFDAEENETKRRKIEIRDILDDLTYENGDWYHSET